MLSTTALPALGATITWSGATNDEWTEATNWVGGVAPGGADTAVVDIAGGPVVDGVAATPVSIMRIGDSATGNLTIQNGGELGSTGHTYVGFLAAGSGTVTVSDFGSELASGNDLYIGIFGSGMLTIENGAVVSAANTYFATQNTGSGIATVTGAGSTLASGGELRVGNSGMGTLTITDGGSASAEGLLYVGNTNGSDGTLNILGGGTVSNTGIGYIGNAAGSNGEVTITGAGSTWTNSSELRVGNSGTGTLMIADGGQVSNGTSATVGSSVGSSGSVTVTGPDSAWASTGSMTIGNTGTGDLSVLDGGSVSGSHIYLGLGASGSGTATVSGSDSTIASAGEVRIGNSGSGSMLVEDSGLVSASSILYLGANNDSTGTLDIASGGVVTSGSHAYLGYAAGSEGTVTVSDANSALQVTGQLWVGGSGTGTMTVSNGGMVSNISNGIIGNAAGSIGEATVSGAGSTWTNSSELRIGSSGTGTLTVQDGGSASIASILYIGLNDGSDGTLDILSGGSVSNTGNGIIGANAGASGAVTVSGAGSTWTNSDELRVGFSGAGVLSVSDGATVETGGILQIAQNAGSTGTLNIGAADGDAAAAAGTIDADSVTFGAGTGTIVFNHTDMNYAFTPDLIGNGVLNFLAGNTILNGDNSGFTGTMAGSADVNVADGELNVASDSSGFSGTTTIANAILRVNGQLGGDTIIGSGGTLYGTGALGDVTFNNGSTAAPGNSIGTTNVVNVVFNPGSVFEVELNAAGQSDRIAATGTATINGGSVTIIPFPDYAVATPYTILTAAGGVGGTFDSVTGTGFVTGQLAYDPNTVFLTLSADADALAAAARTPNQQAVAQSTANATGNDAVDALAFLPDDASARQAFDALSGEMHASLSSTQIMEQNRLRQIALQRQPHVATTLGDGTLWAVGSHTRGQIDGDGNAASIEGRNSGIMVGIETQLEDAHIGLAIGQSASDLDVDDRNSWAQSTNYHFMAYGGTALGNSDVSLDGGASWTWHEVETDRAIAYSGFNDRSEADYDAQTGQVFASLNQTFHIDDTDLRPHIDGAFIHQVGGSFREDGEAGLEAGKQSRNIGVTTLGIDAAHAFAIDETNELTLSGGVGWQHVIGDTDSDRRVAFRDTPATARTVKGVSLARDALSVNSAIEYTVGDSVNFSLSYDALLAADSSEHGIGGQIGIRF